MEDSATRFGRHLQQVMRQPDVASVQDELVLHAGLLMQDALADQEMPSHEVQASREIITGTLCPGAEARCGKVKACLETIIGLYHPQEADHQEVSAAVAALMSEIVDWLDEHSVAIPVK